MKRILIVSLLALAGAAQAKEEQKDLAALAAPCAACHGENGAKPITPDYPVIAGQYANYLEHSLKEYKTGKRKNAVMAGQVAALSDADIRLLSRHFGAQQSHLHTPSVHGKAE
ncbi:cytochrome c [Solimonas sp. K1W22B-7]|uniref:c-type cytochrome n=1 Tax=Solimonas sp. K1W22B-7 TaxID=2303331 RepID=UPI000E3356E5|nr:c-type cytochrome [Solimonas sp. K1W22B-7]AXQ27387.1 cytochrome c [Solimonas sp. K1W22B-7]